MFVGQCSEKLTPGGRGHRFQGPVYVTVCSPDGRDSIRVEVGP